MRNLSQIFRPGSVRSFLSAVVYHSRLVLTQQLHKIRPPINSNPIFDSSDWDILVVLDACQADVFQTAAQSFDYLSDANFEDTFSNAGYSKEWMESNFVDKFTDDMTSTIHVTGNPFSDQVLSSKDWAILDEAWRYAWDDTLGTILPGPIIDRAIDHWRRRTEHGADRMIVHLMQPHLPFIRGKTELHGGQKKHPACEEPTLWDHIIADKISINEVYDLFVENTCVALEQVETLINNITGDVYLTADHAEMFGEHGLYGHHPHVAYPSLRRVPWQHVEATDSHAYKPPKYDTTNSGESVSERLQSLGYVE